MWIYIVVIALAIVFIYLVMQLVRVMPDIVNGKDKLGKRHFLMMIAVVAVGIVMFGLVSTHRCAGCANLSATHEYDGQLYCDTCYEAIAG